MSTLLELKQFVAQLMSDTGMAIYTAANITRQLNFAQNRIAEELECCEATSTFAALDNVAEALSGGIALPVGFIRPVKVIYNGTALKELPMEQSFPTNDTTTLTSSDEPMGFYVTSSIRSSATSSYRRMEFYPAQTKAQTVAITLVYKTLPTALSADTDVSQVPVVLHEAMAWRAIAQCKLQENDYEGYKLLMDNEFTPRLLMAQYSLGPGSADSYGEIRDVSSVFGSIDTGVW